MTPLVIIPCGSAKAPTAQPARDLYRGAYFKMCLRWALAVAQPDDIRILSAKYGLVELDRRLEPYELLMGSSGSISAARLREQATEQRLLERPVLMAAGARYRALVTRVWPAATDVLAGTRGMGYQMARLKYLTEEANRGANSRPSFGWT
jgi:hypothetical protein